MTPCEHIADGTVALVTGASSGIGEAVAVALVAGGCRVIGAARRGDRLQGLADRLGDRFHPLALDVTDPGSVDGLIGRLPEGLREVRILVNNAGHGVGSGVRFDLHGADEAAGMVETNVVGLMRVTRAIAPGMVARDAGDIVNIGSVLGVKPLAANAAYTASKYAVHGFSDNLRADFAETGLRVIEILPGLVRTEFALQRMRGDQEKAKAYYDDRDWSLGADDVARAVVFALDQPAHVTIAQVLVLPTAQW